MRVILTQRVHNLGNTGDVVSVADGYGRNYLIPRQLAVFADEKNVKRLRHKKLLLEQQLKKERIVAQDFAKRLEQTQVTITRKAGENDKLFGSVTSQDIVEVLKAEELEVDRKSVVIPEPIKTLGYHQVKVKVAPEVEASFKVWVVSEE